MNWEEMTAADQYAATNATCMMIGLAIVGALKQRDLVDPLRVAGLAEWMAANLPNTDLSASATSLVRGHLVEFAKLVQVAATMPSGAGRA